MKYVLAVVLVIALIFGGILFFTNQPEVVNEPSELSSDIEDNASEGLEEETTQDLTIEYGDITPDEARTLLEDNPDIILLDVRSVEEYEERHIPDSVLIPLQELSARVDELDKDETYIIYCRSGNRSRQAFEFLQSKGFEKLYNLMGGITAYYN